MGTQKIHLLIVFFLTGLCLSVGYSARAENAAGSSAFRSTQFPLPRFVSVASDEVFVRTGPGQRYPVEWVYRKKGVPVEIILEYDVWRKIKDFNGQVGWVHHTLLSGRRAAFILGNETMPLYKKPVQDEHIQAYAEARTLVSVEQCNGQWCFVNASGYKGWIVQNKLWGVYESEVFD
ncbi:MAG: SH3 domain-containing protein [Alphaproteobacteria bacterium]|nr:SH3 domain-containing protein [Alphaproteobacteria bacterium]